ncbi:UNVERIFIED_CONTAM: hypothetical protein Slati_2656300 [Sesamum latifolium]|uniref:Uncharacterized protein n=1 Tax=Sesamum latifolium TaxID=2727402 RepID=A0AAW2VWE7_9LAMI
MAPNRVGDNSSVEVSEEVLRRGIGYRAYNPRGGSVGAKAGGVDPPQAEVGGISITTCKA